MTEAVLLIIVVIGSYLMGMIRGEIKGTREGFEQGYQRGRREGWESAVKHGLKGKVIEFSREG